MTQRFFLVFVLSKVAASVGGLGQTGPMKVSKSMSIFAEAWTRGSIEAGLWNDLNDSTEFPPIQCRFRLVAPSFCRNFATCMHFVQPLKMLM